MVDAAGWNLLVVQELQDSEVLAVHDPVSSVPALQKAVHAVHNPGPGAALYLPALQVTHVLSCVTVHVPVSSCPVGHDDVQVMHDMVVEATLGWKLDPAVQAVHVLSVVAEHVSVKNSPAPHVVLQVVHGARLELAG